MSRLDWFAAAGVYGMLLSVLLRLVFGWWIPLVVVLVYVGLCCWAFGNCPPERPQDAPPTEPTP